MKLEDIIDIIKKELFNLEAASNDFDLGKKTAFNEVLCLLEELYDV